MTLHAPFMAPLLMSLLTNAVTKAITMTEDDYCQMSKEHILCGKFTNRTLILQQEYTNASKEDISTYLFYFNGFRSSLAGRIPSTNGKGMMPKAANMQGLRWNPLCYKAAFTHMKHCNYDGWANSPYCLHKCGDCKNLGDFESVLFSTEVIGPYYSGTVSALMGLLQNLTFNAKSVQKFVLSDDFRNQDFFQVLANAQLTEIGCFAKRRFQGLGFLLSCVLGDVAGLDGKPVYMEGPPCSNCPPKTNCSSNRETPGLCVLPEGVGVPQIEDISFDVSDAQQNNPNLELLDRPEYDYEDLSDGSYAGDAAPPKRTFRKKKKTTTTPKSAAKSSRDTTSSGSPSLGDTIVLGGLVAVVLLGYESVHGFPGKSI